MLEYKITVDDKAVVNSLGYIRKNLGRLVGMPTVQESADKIVNIAKTLVPVWTGQLQTSIRWMKVQEDDKIQQINVSAKAMSPEGVDYAPFTEFPVKPHWVSLKKHPMLREWLEDKEGKGEFFYGQSVFVKGPKRPYWLRDSVNQVEEQLEDIADRVLVKFIRGLG